MPQLDQLTTLLQPLTAALKELDLADPQAAQAQLSEAFPPSAVSPLRQSLQLGMSEGWLVLKDATPTIRFGRVSKASPQTDGFSIDIVDMSGSGAEHTHPHGEVSICFATEGQPQFEGCPDGWVVLPPGSHHTPTVSGGRMTILYFLPSGSVKWGPPSS